MWKLRDAIYLLSDAIFFGKEIFFNGSSVALESSFRVCMADQSVFFQEKSCILVQEIQASRGSKQNFKTRNHSKKCKKQE